MKVAVKGVMGFIRSRLGLRLKERQEQVVTPRLVRSDVEARRRKELLPISACARALEFVRRRFRIRPPLHRQRLDFFARNFRFDFAKVRDLIGFVPQVALIEGSVRTANWYPDRGM